MPLPAAETAAPSPAQAPPPPAPRWWREPLLHFVLLGGLLFGIDHALVAREDDPRTIVVGAEVDREASEVFKASRGREPTKAELVALRRVWLDNEVLYREGVALQVDKGDTAIRDRVIFKALSVIDSKLEVPVADDAVLRSWFEQRRAKYDTPARFDFQEAALSGDNTEAAVRGFTADLNQGTPGDAKAGLRVFKGRPRSNLVASYGSEFAAALEESPPGLWQAYLTRDGWRAIRLDAQTPVKPADFELLHDVVLQDWTDASHGRAAFGRGARARDEVQGQDRDG